jgi:hypothetical protein
VSFLHVGFEPTDRCLHTAVRAKVPDVGDTRMGAVVVTNSSVDYTAWCPGCEEYHDWRSIRREPAWLDRPLCTQERLAEEHQAG